MLFQEHNENDLHASYKSAETTFRSMRRDPLDFEIQSAPPLGQGSFGKVLLVRDKADGQIYAMKMINKKLSHNELFIKNLKQEIRIHKHLRHMYITRLYYFMEDATNVYLILSYAELGTH